MLEDAVITATLTDSQTTRGFVSLLPLTLTLEDYAGTEKISLCGYREDQLFTPKIINRGRTCGQ